MNQSCFLEVEKNNGKSFVRQLLLRTRKSEILFDMKESYCLRACTNKALEHGIWCNFYSFSETVVFMFDSFCTL